MNRTKSFELLTVGSKLLIASVNLHMLMVWSVLCGKLSVASKLRAASSNLMGIGMKLLFAGCKLMLTNVKVPKPGYKTRIVPLQPRVSK